MTNTANSAHVPVYRYFTVDLLSNEILQEIPFRGVSWGRALKSAGSFSGKIPVIPETESMDIYNSTLPGVTALYVVRDDEAVWGGIIWSRSYDVIGKVLSISASEFTSYLHHRKIWKTWNHQHGATVVAPPLSWIPGALDRTNGFTEPSFEVSSGANVEVRRNYHPNPGAGSQSNGLAHNAGSGNGAGISSVSAPWSVSGVASRVTWSTGGGGNGDFGVIFGTSGITPGDTFTIVARYQVGRTGMILATPTGWGGSPSAVIAPTARSRAANFTATAGVTYTDWATFTMPAVPQTLDRMVIGLVSPLTGDVIDRSMFDIYLGEYQPNRPWFSGSHTTDTEPNFTQVWSGTVNNSYSIQRAPGLGFTANSSRQIYQSKAWAAEGTSSLAIFPTGATNGAIAQWSLSSMGLSPGDTATFIAVVQVNETLASWDYRGRKFYIANSGGGDIIASPKAVPNVPGVYELRWTTLLPSNASTIRFMHGGGIGNEPMRLDLLTAVKVTASEGAVLRTNLIANTRMYSGSTNWSNAGTATGTVSNGRDAVLDLPGFENMYRRDALGGTLTNGSRIYRNLLDTVIGETYTFGAWVGIDDANGYELRITTTSGGTGAVAASPTLTTAGATVGRWRWVTLSFVATATTMYAHVYKTVGGTTASWFAMTGTMMVLGAQALTSADYFDGSWNDTSNRRYRFTGSYENSSSEELVAAIDVYTGPPFSGDTAASGGPGYIYSWSSTPHGSTSFRTSLVNVPTTVAFDYGSNGGANAGSSVHLEFYEPENFKYNGYYRVAASPAPNTSGFTIQGGESTSDITSVEVLDGTIYFYTASRHGFNGGDSLVVTGTGYDGTYTISVPAGPESDLFTVSTALPNLARHVVAGTAGRPLPGGIYTRVTVTVRTDTYDYVRNLLNSAFSDFVGTDFPNVYIEPGISYGLGITHSGLGGGLATITTAEDHNLAVGQAVQVQDLNPQFDGEYQVTAIPADNVFRYEKSGSQSVIPVTPIEVDIVGVESFAGEAIITTSGPHFMLVGQNVEVFCGYDVDPNGQLFNGNYKITAVPTPTTFKYAVMSQLRVSPTTLVPATATVSASTMEVVSRKLSSNVVTIETETPHGFSTGNSVAIAGVPHITPLLQKSLDAPNNTARLLTENDHEVDSTLPIVISGLRDTVAISRKRTTPTAATLTTSPAHNFAVGSSVVISEMIDDYDVASYSIASNVASVVSKTPTIVTAGSEITINGVIDDRTITDRFLSVGVAVLTVGSHNFWVNDELVVTGIDEVGTIVSKEVVNGIGILTLSLPHNFVETMEITISGMGAPFDGERSVLSVTDTRVFVELDDETLNIAPARAVGQVVSPDSIFNGTFNISAVTTNTVSFFLTGRSVNLRSVNATASGWSIINGTHTVSSVTGFNTINFALTANNVASHPVNAPVDEEDIAPTISMLSPHNGTRTLTAVTRDTITFAQSLPATSTAERVIPAGTVSGNSIFNGTRTVTSVGSDWLSIPLTGYSSNVLEEDADLLSTMSVPTLFNGTYTITSTPTPTTFTYARTYRDVSNRAVYGLGTGEVVPTAVISTFGPYPGNASLGIEFSTTKYSGVNVSPTAYRGFELTSVGEALDLYSDSIDGFEYRIDCSYDSDANRFRRKFVLIPINFPNPPAPGESSPPSRFGADKLVFEFPGGSVSTMTLEESAEDSATRFFASGETDLGPDVGPNIGIASAEDLLSGKATGRRWPLLDVTEQIDAIDDESVLYAYARKYLAESRPPDATLSVSVNGSIAPFVGSYSPGDWCTLIVDDPFVQMRLKSGMEPRDTMIIRKIDAYKVTVPDGTTFPERVELTLIPEWEVDKRG